MVHGPLIAVASVVEYKLWGMWASVVVAHRLSCPEAHGLLITAASLVAQHGL